MCELLEGFVDGLEWFGDGDGVDGFSVGGVFSLGYLWWVGVVDDGGGEVLGIYGEEEGVLVDEVLVFLEA